MSLNPKGGALSDIQTRQRLAAILAADAVGYSRLMSANDHSTVAALDAAAGERVSADIRFRRVDSPRDPRWDNDWSSDDGY